MVRVLQVDLWQLQLEKQQKKRKQTISVKASSEAQLDDRIDDIDILLIGPHLAYIKDEVINKTKGKNIEVAVIPQMIYGSLNGEKALDLINNLED